MSKQSLKNRELIVGTNKALKIVQTNGFGKISLPTLINWIRVYKIGKKIGGRWYINKQQLIDMLIKGNSNGEARPIKTTGTKTQKAI